jgi:hypothetical protein
LKRFGPVGMQTQTLQFRKPTLRIIPLCVSFVKEDYFQVNIILILQSARFHPLRESNVCLHVIGFARTLHSLIIIDIQDTIKHNMQNVIWCI